MAQSLPKGLTLLANEAQHDSESARIFLARMYETIHEIAKNQAAGQFGPGPGATDITHEVAEDFMEGGKKVQYMDRNHVVAGFVARVRNRIIDWHRRRRRQKRGNGVAHLPIHSPAALDVRGKELDPSEWMAIKDAFELLKQRHPKVHHVVMLRNAGHSVQEVANLVDRSPKTVIRCTAFGTAFLYKALRSEPRAPLSNAPQPGPNSEPGKPTD